jgi:hypothetical protein
MVAGEPRLVPGFKDWPYAQWNKDKPAEWPPLAGEHSSFLDAKAEK